MFDKFENTIYPPHTENPDSPPAPIHMPMVYVKETMRWEYKRLVRSLDKFGPDEDELNELGQHGWEMAGMFTHDGQVHIYFKRLIS